MFWQRANKNMSAVSSVLVFYLSSAPASVCEYGWSAFLIISKTTAIRDTFVGFRSIYNTMIQTKTNDVSSVNSLEAITDIIFTV